MGKLKGAVFFLLCCATLQIATMSEAATVNIKNGTFTIIPIHGAPIEVTSMTVEKEDIDLLMYIEKNGKEGFIHRTNIKNVNELLGLIKSDGTAESSQKLMAEGREDDRIQQEIRKEKQQRQVKLESKAVESKKIVKKAVEVSEISTKSLRNDSIGNVWLSIKVTATNNGTSDKVFIRIQAVDYEGFAIENEIITGVIPQGTTRSLTDTTAISEREYRKITKWKVAE
jgi:hypothetical protein